jgi:hypothetical protein
MAPLYLQTKNRSENMKNTKRILAITSLAAALSAGTALAQNNGNNNNNNNNNGGGGRNNWRNMSTEERAQERLTRDRDDLEVKDDAEWKIISPLVQKVRDAERKVIADRMSGIMGRFRGGGGGDTSGGGDNNGGSRRTRGGGGGFFGEASPESDTLKKAVDGKASNSEMKAAIAKFQEARKANEAALQKAQDDLRKVLSVRQEGIATLNGLL